MCYNQFFDQSLLEVDRGWIDRQLCTVWCLTQTFCARYACINWGRCTTEEIKVLPTILGETIHRNNNSPQLQTSCHIVASSAEKGDSMYWRHDRNHRHLYILLRSERVTIVILICLYQSIEKSTSPWRATNHIRHDEITNFATSPFGYPSIATGSHRHYLRTP